ncbi:hypothetical protein [Streptomyces sp. NPDC001781]
MTGLSALAPWWLLALVDLAVGSVCVAVAMRLAPPHRPATGVTGR